MAGKKLALAHDNIASIIATGPVYIGAMHGMAMRQVLPQLQVHFQLIP